MESQNSNLISEESDQSFVLMASLATGNGEAALKSNSNMQHWKIARRSPGPMATSVSQIQPQFNHKQPVQVWDTNRNTPVKNIPAKEE
jgi:hypothetical protein